MLNIKNIISGIRPTGFLHLGHYYGILKNWIKLQKKFKCLFFIADLHALTTNIFNENNIKKNSKEIIIDCLSIGINPKKSILFIQSQISEQIELYLILSMITPISWLNRNPINKKKFNKLNNNNSYGFLGYPVLQASDILIYNSNIIPIGYDQIPHIEIIRKIISKFNILINKIKKKKNILYNIKIIFNKKKIIKFKKIKLIFKKNFFFIKQYKKENIFLKPKYILDKFFCFPGLDGKKMSKSNNNYINIRENKKKIINKINKIKTDPKRIYKNIPGNPNHCNLWKFHLIYSNKLNKNLIYNYCKNAIINCKECKEIILNIILKKQIPILEKAQKYIDNPNLINDIIYDGYCKAKKIAKKNLYTIKKILNI